MKKILSIISVFLLAITLVSCSSDKMPKVNKKDQVELTKEELKKELSNLDVLSSNSLEVKFNTEFEIKNEASIKGNIDFNLIFDGNLNKMYLDGNVNLKSGSESIKGDAKVYYNNDGKLYLNPNIALKTGMDLDFKGKYYVEAGNILDQIGVNPGSIEGINPEEIQENLLELMTNFDGLTFYKNEKDFSIKLQINKDNIKANSELVADLISQMNQVVTKEQIESALNEISDLDFVFILKITDKKISELGLSLNFDYDKNGEKIDLKASLYLSLNGKLPKFPNFSDYIQLY